MSLDMNLVPIVIEQSGKGERSFDIFSSTSKGKNYFFNLDL